MSEYQQEIRDVIFKAVEREIPIYEAAQIAEDILMRHIRADKLKFEGMAECTMCESGTFEPVEIFYSKTGYVTYCRRCWKEFGNAPVDKPVDNTPEAR